MEDIPEGNPMHGHGSADPPGSPGNADPYGAPPPPPAYDPGYPVPAQGQAPAPPAPPAYDPGYAQGHGWPTKPGKLQAISIMMLISGILNCLGALMLILTCYGVVLAPLLATAGILEIIHATKLLKDPIEVYKPATGIAILEICCILGCGVTACVIGILNLVFWGDPEVVQYYRDVALARGYQPQV